MTAVLDAAAIAQRVPHSGAMCLLEQVDAWDAREIRCRTTSHTRPDHPMRSESGLLAPCGIEIAAQAMALHGALVAPPDTPPSAGYLASVRSVRLHVTRLDDVVGALHVHAERIAGDASQVLYRFALTDRAGAPLVDGRATVVLNTPLAEAR